MKKKIIAIVGPTTAPGRGLIRAILGDKHGHFVARALERDIASEEAQLLTMTGIEVMRGDLDDEATLRQAFSGAHGVFCFLLPKEPGAIAPTLARAAAVARAAKATALEHVVWARLDDTALLPLHDEEATPTYFDDFGAGEKFEPPIDTRQPFTELAIPTTFLQATWHSSLVTGRTAEEIGQCAYRIFKSRELIGKTVSVSEELMALELARPPVTPDSPGRLSRTATAWLLGAFAAVVLGSVAVMIRFYRQPSEVAPHPFSERSSTPGRPTRSFGPLKPRDPVIDPVINPVTTADTNLEEPPSMPDAPASHLRPKKRGVRAGQPGGPKRDMSVAPTPTTAGAIGVAESHGAIAATSPATSQVEQSASPAALPRTGPGQTAKRLSPVSPPAGSVDPRAVTATVRAHAGEVRSCFDRALMEHSDLHGRLVVKAMLDASGNVISASATRTMEGGARLENCVLSAFQSWTFPPPTDGARAPITYSFSFE